MNDMIEKTKEQEQIETQNQMEMPPQTQREVRQDYDRSSLFFLCRSSTIVAAAFLGILSLFGLIALHPAWFCAPLLLHLMRTNLRFCRKCIYTMRNNISLEEVTIAELQRNLPQEARREK